uniref:hypothetical protein n=1 Tax=Acinetobacter ursingii TaxID=108980 RepID=UPI001C091167
LLEFKTIPYCDLIQYYPIQNFRQMAYRYPTALTIAKYWLLTQNQHLMTQDSEKIRQAYVLLTKSGKHSFNTKICD